MPEQPQDPERPTAGIAADELDGADLDQVAGGTNNCTNQCVGNAAHCGGATNV